MLLRRQVLAGSDDARRRNMGASQWSTTTSNLHIGSVGGASDQWGCALRFQDIHIPQGATISHAFLTVTTNLTFAQTVFRTRIKAQAIDDAPTFTDETEFLTRTWTTAVIDWDDGQGWVVQQKHTSPDIAAAIQEVVDRSGWQLGNALALYWNDDDDRSDAGARRAVYAYNGSQAKAAVLTVEYQTTIDVQVIQSSDDVRLNSISAFQLTQPNEIAGYYGADSIWGGGMRFDSLQIPRGSTITEAHLKLQAFASDDKDTVRTRIKIELADNPATFTDRDNFLARPWSDPVEWNGIEHWVKDTWYNSVDIKTLIQQVVDRPRWELGNAIAIFWDDLDGLSDHVNQTCRRAYSYDNDPPTAPMLHIEYIPPPHIIIDGRYISQTPAVNRAYVIGRDAEGNPVHGTAVSQAEVDLVGERLDFHQLLSIPSSAKAEDVAEAVLAKMRITGSRGFISIPPNCGAELWDVVRITDQLCAQAAADYRIAGIRTEYQPKAARYHQTLYLAAP